MNISLSKETHLSSFSEINTEVEKVYTVEYFPEKYVTMKLLSTNSDNLENSLNELSDGNPISADFEWKPDVNESFHPISIFQFCSSKGVIVIENDNILLSKIDDNSNDNDDEKDITNLQNYNALKNFLLNNKFFGKGTTTDKLKLKMMFDHDFEIEDIEETFLKPNELPLGFSTLVQRLIGRPSAHFKDPKVSRSDWSKRPLSVLQLLYAGFDAYSMYLCYNRIITLKTEEIKVLFSEKNSLFTKKHKLKSEVSKKQSLNLKIKFFVSFNDHLESSGSLRNQEVDPMKFIKHEENGTKYSLFYMYLALRKIQSINGNENNKTNDNDNDNENNNNNTNDNDNDNDNDNSNDINNSNNIDKCNDDCKYKCISCDLILPSKKTAIDHLWSTHYSDIPSIYFLWQSPAYLSGCIKQIAYASQNLVIEDDHIKCALCEKKLQQFRSLYTHFRIYHMTTHPPGQTNTEKAESEKHEDDDQTVAKNPASDDYTVVDYPDLKEILYEHLNKTGKINKETKTCHICENFLNDQIISSNSAPLSTSVKITDAKTNFENEKELIEHCWNNHPGVFISLWKHRPSPYPKDLFEKCNDFGVMTIEKMLCGTMYNGVYACSFCLVGFDSPGELFIHLFHRHTIIQAVRAAEINSWVLKIRDLPVILQNFIRKMNYCDIITTLENEGVIKIDRSTKIEIKPFETKKAKKAKPKEAKQQKEIQSNTQQKETQLNAQQKEIQSNTQQKEIQSNTQQKETQSNSQQKETQLNTQQKEIQSNAQQNKAQSNSQQKETQSNSQQNEAQSNTQQKEAQSIPQQKRTKTNKKQTKSQQNESQVSHQIKKSKQANPNKDEDNKENENNELELHPFYCNECKVNLNSADERWNHLLEKHLIIDFSNVRYRCHDDLPFLNDE